MKTYKVKTNLDLIYYVNANNEEEALDKVIDGECEPIENYVHSDEIMN